jgi:hypothetical protein
MPLSTVAEYVAKARELLQDKTAPYRYTDAELKGSLGMALYEARRLRPDLFIGTNGIPQDVDLNSGDATVVTMDQQYRMQLVYYIVGDARMRDEEEGSDQLAAAYKKTFSAQLLTLI